MDYLRNFILRTTPELMQLFSNVLLEFWSEYNVLLWSMNESFSQLKGPELLCFIKNSSKIIQFLQNNFERTNAVIDLCEMLKLWEEITPFLLITTIDEKEKYHDELKKWCGKLDSFYKVGGRSFMTKNKAHPGDDETFYLHVLRYYLPRIAKSTFEKHQLGLGIFTMQGFERRNKESKNTLKRFSNNKGNVLMQNMRRLWDVFYYRTTAV